MPNTFKPVPTIPKDVGYAAETGELVVFVGAGISKLIGCPSWSELADKVLKQLVPDYIDHYDLSQIRGIADPKKILSVAENIARSNGIDLDFGQPLEAERKSGDVYSFLNSFNCTFLTTNYDKFLSPDSRQMDEEQDWRFYGRDNLLSVNLDRNGNVIHLHGCIDDPSSLVVTSKDYLEHYLSEEVQTFLKYLFEKKVVLFLGYGLEEIEILEFIFRQGKVNPVGKPGLCRRFILQGFFNAEMALFDLLGEYYRSSFNTELIGFPKDYEDYSHQIKIIADWSKHLKFGGLTSADEAALLEEEIGD